LPQLIRIMAEVAPQVTLSTVRESGVNLHDAMADGCVDLDIGLLPQLKAGFFSSACSASAMRTCTDGGTRYSRIR
jgi:hypothetical protein